MPVKKRTLYDCFNAKVLGENIYCVKGHPFSVGRGGTQLNILRLKRGTPLKMDICQDCPDFDEMDGGTLNKSDRGW